VPLAMRRSGVTAEICEYARRGYVRRASSVPVRTTPPPSSAPGDVSVFPGDKLPNLSDFARLQCAIQASDFRTALSRQGLEPIAYGRLTDRWARRRAGAPALRAEYAAMLRRETALNAMRMTARIPHQDRVVFPGERLAKVSDFARISRAARRGEF